MWKGSKTDLENLSNKLNPKHRSIKFKCKILKERISFLRTEKYIKNKKLYTQIFRNKTNTQDFPNLKKPKLFKKTATCTTKHYT